MSYVKSDAVCDWCIHKIGDGDSIACGDCYETRESELSEARNEIKALKQQIEELEERAAEMLEKEGTDGTR